MLGRAPLPAMLVAGSPQLPIVWRNPPVAQSAAGTAASLAVLRAGFVGSAGHRALLDVLGGAVPSAVFAHDSWTSPIREPARTLAWRPRTASATPVAALVELPPAAVSGGATASIDAPSDLAWATAVGVAGRTLRERPPGVAVRAAVKALARGIGAADGALAIVAAGDLRVVEAAAGLLPRRSMRLPAGDTLYRGLVDGGIDWLPLEERRQLGLADRYELVAVPLLAPHDRVGVLLLAFAHEVPLADVARELLAQFGTSLALTVTHYRATGVGPGW